MNKKEVCIKLLETFIDLKDWGTNHSISKQEDNLTYLFCCLVDYLIDAFYDKNDNAIRKVLKFIDEIVENADDTLFKSITFDLMIPLYALLVLTKHKNEFFNVYLNDLNSSTKKILVYVSNHFKDDDLMSFYTKTLLNPKIDSLVDATVISVSDNFDSLVLEFDVLYLYSDDVRCVYHLCVVLKDYTLCNKEKDIKNQEVKEYAKESNKSLSTSFNDFLNSNSDYNIEEINIDYVKKIFNIYGYPNQENNSNYLNFTFSFSEIEFLYN